MRTVRFCATYPKIALLALLAGACGPRGTPEAAPQSARGAQSAQNEPTPDAKATAKAEAEAEKTRRRELLHHVVFADRIRQPYLLLLPADTTIAPEALTRERLLAQIQQTLRDQLDEPEVRRLLEMVRTPPEAAGAGAPRLIGDDPSDPEDYADARELLALHLEPVAIAEVLAPAALEDPELLRGLTPEERAGLRARRQGLVLRGEYRNQREVRGLRLLQTLVRIVADAEGALIHDPDTLETSNLATFSARRLRGGQGNIADQLVVIPFPDLGHPGHLRLATRGMRRFGSVDLELAGIPPEPAAVDRATHLLYGLGLALLRLGEIDRSGIATAAPESIVVEYAACLQATGNPAATAALLPRCDGCPAATAVHLVERDPEPQDPAGHVVARVVAPRPRSDSPTYDHPAWVAEALAELFGGA